MTVPNNVLWFEVLLYLSLMLDSLSAAFHDRTPSPGITEQTIHVRTMMAAGLILLLVHLVHLAARRRKNWPRWVLVTALALSLISLVPVVGQRGLEWGIVIEVISCTIAAMGLYFSFTGDAEGWFDK